MPDQIRFTSDDRPAKPLKSGLMTTITIAQRLERLPITRYQRLIFAVIATAWFFDCLDVAMMTFVLAKISEDFSLTVAQAGTLGSMSFLGMFLGAASAGILADKYGRVIVFRASIIIWGLASLACAFAPTLEILMFSRVVLGIGLAMELPVGQSMICEFVPARVRGRYVALLEGMWPIGFMSAGLLAMFVVPTWGWRGAFVAEAIPAVFVLFIRRMVPESPRWLADSGQIQKAEEVISSIENNVRNSLPASEQHKLPIGDSKQIQSDIPADGILSNAGTTGERNRLQADANQSSNYTEEIKTDFEKNNAPVKPESDAGRNGFSANVLFQKPYLKRTVMLWSLWFFALLGYYGLTTWLGALLEEKGFDFAKSTDFIIKMSAAGIPGFFTAAWLVESWGRKPSMILTLCCSAVSAYFYGTATDTTVMIVCGLIMQFFLFGMWSVLYAYTPELYPTFARATGAGFASSFGRLGALLGPWLIGNILPIYGQHGVFGMAAGALFSAAVMVSVLGEETKGKMLEEI